MCHGRFCPTIHSLVLAYAHSDKLDTTAAEVTAQIRQYVEKNESTGDRATLKDRISRGMQVLEQTEATLRGVAVDPIEPDIQYECGKCRAFPPLLDVVLWFVVAWSLLRIDCPACD